MISKQALEEFKSIWRKQFNEEISDDKAIESATRLLTLMKIVYRPVKKDWGQRLGESDAPTLVA
jgi:hypothetical protein